MPKVTVEGEQIEVPDGVTVLQARELAGMDVSAPPLSRATEQEAAEC